MQIAGTILFFYLRIVFQKHFSFIIIISVHAKARKFQGGGLCSLALWQFHIKSLKGEILSSHLNLNYRRETGDKRLLLSLDFQRQYAHSGAIALGAELWSSTPICLYRAAEHSKKQLSHGFKKAGGPKQQSNKTAPEGSSCFYSQARVSSSSF